MSALLSASVLANKQNVPGVALVVFLIRTPRSFPLTFHFSLPVLMIHGPPAKHANVSGFSNSARAPIAGWLAGSFPLAHPPKPTRLCPIHHQRLVREAITAHQFCSHTLSAPVRSCLSSEYPSLPRPPRFLSVSCHNTIHTVLTLPYHTRRPQPQWISLT